MTKKDRKSTLEIRNAIKLYFLKKNIIIFLLDIVDKYFAQDQRASAGNDIAIFYNTSLQKCIKVCSENPKCISLAYNFKRVICWLKDKIRLLKDYTPRINSVFYRKDLRGLCDNSNID